MQIIKNIPNDVLQIALLANSCPAAMGSCVYKARSINAFFNPLAQYLDYNLCVGYLPANKGGQNIYQEDNALIEGGEKTINEGIINLDKFDYYPNPIHPQSMMTVEYVLPNKGLGQINIYDVVGKLVQTIVIGSDIQRVTFELANITDGIYTIEISQSSKIIKSAKLIVN